MEPDREFFECVVEPHRDSLRVRLAGEFDMDAVQDFQNAVADLPLDGHSRLVLDLRGLDFCDSSGLRAILMLAKAVPDDTSFSIIPGSETVQRAFAVTGLEDALPFVDPGDLGQP